MIPANLLAGQSAAGNHGESGSETNMTNYIIETRKNMTWLDAALWATLLASIPTLALFADTKWQATAYVCYALALFAISFGSAIRALLRK